MDFSYPMFVSPPHARANGKDLTQIAFYPAYSGIIICCLFIPTLRGQLFLGILP
jgi:hypothetical protein